MPLATGPAVPGMGSGGQREAWLRAIFAFGEAGRGRPAPDPGPARADVLLALQGQHVSQADATGCVLGRCPADGISVNSALPQTNTLGLQLALISVSFAYLILCSQGSPPRC